MAKVFVIPDVHLKPAMFTQAGELIQENHPDQIVCLMDIPDDYNKTYDKEHMRLHMKQQFSLPKSIRTAYGATGIMTAAINGTTR